jgi:4-amino-4-deoxy-L-arabinose transferase-like glycosyltransferase
MDFLTAFGLFAVTAMLIFYALEDRSSWYILAFAVACALGSVYGFLQGAWPFGVVEAVWALVAVRRWRVKSAAGGHRSAFEIMRLPRAAR